MMKVRNLFFILPVVLSCVTSVGFSAENVTEGISQREASDPITEAASHHGRELTQAQATALLLADPMGPKISDPTPGRRGAALEKSWDVFFTGKPKVEGLGHVFAFRNYRPNLQKWQTTDPLGYPDGLNNTAYVNNAVVRAVDPLTSNLLFERRELVVEE
jgi:RHS repeat-associated protein